VRGSRGRRERPQQDYLATPLVVLGDDFSCSDFKVMESHKMNKSVSPLRNVVVHAVYQFHHICTSGGSADDEFGFPDPHFLFVFCIVTILPYVPISLGVP